MFRLNDNNQPLCAAESFRFTLEDYQQVCKLRQWYRERNPLVIENAGTAADQSDLSTTIEVCFH